MNDKEVDMSWLNDLVQPGKNGIRNQDIAIFGSIIFLSMIMVCGCGWIWTKKEQDMVKKKKGDGSGLL